jgi:RNA polymerase sigma-70 factor, ECF subfamily
VTEAGPAEGSDLVRRLAADEPAALERTYELYGARCNAIAYRVLQNDEAARDAVQEAFLSLWRHRRGLVVRTGGLWPWLSVVTRNAAIGILRSETWRARREQRFDANKTEPPTADPLEVAAARGDATRLRGALQALPPEQQNVVELAYFRFLTMTQIAEQTATPVGTVKRRAQLALRRLARLMSEDAT